MKSGLILSSFIFLSFGNAIAQGNQVLSLSQSFLKFLKKNGEYALEISGGNTQCAKDLKILLSDLITAKKWALNMIDASAKPPSGMLYGHYFVPGNFDQCINIKEDKNESIIQGKYCTVSLTPSTKFSNDFQIAFDALWLSNFMSIHKTERYENFLKLIKVSYGLCLPHSCSIENIQTIWNYLEHSLNIPVHAGFNDLMCRTKDQPVESYGYVDDIIIILFVIYFAVLLIGTLYDIICQRLFQEENGSSVWRCFSLHTNAKKIFRTNSEKQAELGCINGIRVLSTIWVIFGHRFLMNGVSGTINSMYLYEWNKEIFSTIVYSAYFAVDTFFTLSGLLISYGFMEYQRKRYGKFNIPMFYFYRILRLSPALLATVLFYIGIFKKIGDGPIWPWISRKFAGGCLVSGWSTMFYLTNFVPFNRQCMEHTWYLAVDTQLYVIAPVLLGNLLTKSRKTVLVCVLGCLVSGVYTFIITCINNYAAMPSVGDISFHRNVYTSTFTRLPPWLIGFLFGYLIFKYQNYKFPKVAVISAWILSLSSLLLIILSHWVLFNYEYSTLLAAIFNSCAKQIWSIALCAIIFLCGSGHGGIINDFLSSAGFRVLVKITYSVYLIHLPVLAYFGATKRHSEYYSNIKSLHDFMGDLLFIFIAGVVWCLAFESPFLAIAKLLFKKEKKADSSSETRDIKYEIQDSQNPIYIQTGKEKDHQH